MVHGSYMIRIKRSALRKLVCNSVTVLFCVFFSL